ncbi:MAG: hypothetical protein NTV58_14525 [Deltaproteobacteria bacterium]|nr:hypothetical protein [Deltaproteobacteria bacterium]
MNLPQHIALTCAASAVMIPFLRWWELLLFAIGSILIDVDHYIVYIQRRKNFNVRGMFQYFAVLDQIHQTVPYAGLFIFHLFDFFLLVGIVCFFHPFLFPLLAGMLFHFTADLIELTRKGRPFIRPYLLIEHLVRRRSIGYPYY